MSRTQLDTLKNILFRWMRETVRVREKCAGKMPKDASLQMDKSEMLFPKLLNSAAVSENPLKRGTGIIFLPYFRV